MISSDIVFSPHGKDWLYDEYATGAGLSFQITNTQAAVQSPYQNIKIVESKSLGKTLLLNNWIYRTEDFGSAMPEMIVHVPMNTGSTPKQRVLLIGGGDGFSTSELLKYPEIEHLDMVDIDEQVVELCRKHFSVAKKAFSDKRVTIHIADGAEYLKEYHGEKYDLILVTGTEAYDAEGKPGISFSLFEDAFYQKCLENLGGNGILVTDGQNGYYGGLQYREISERLKKHFRIVRNYSCTCKYIPGGMYVITIATRGTDPETDIRKSSMKGFYYYNSEIHRSSFSLPQFLLS